MKCHYEVLSIPRDADFEDIKKSYRKLAIKWHPDKNLDNTAVATEQFQLIQQAFEVLSDPHERKWYDDHREAILKGKSGGQYEDDSLDVYEFFTTSCFKGYGDDRKGFYTVYREVFDKIAAEDSEYQTNEDSDFEIPTFGKSDSSFEDVNAFYAYWQSYSTKKSYAWLDPYNAREAPNRRVSRLIESENKKVREKARKARNEEIRELVGFVRKRDKRAQAYAKHLKDLNAEKAKKAEEKRIQKIKERNEELAAFKESEWSKFSNVEKELKNMEASLAAEFGDQLVSDEDSDEDNPLLDSLYCIACEKLYKNPKAFESHESSKKHKENVQRIKESMQESEVEIDDEDISTGGGSNLEGDDTAEEEINGEDVEEEAAAINDEEDDEDLVLSDDEDDNPDVLTLENEECKTDNDVTSILENGDDILSDDGDDDDDDDDDDPVVIEYINSRLEALKLKKNDPVSVPEEKPRKLSKKQKKKQKQSNKIKSHDKDESEDELEQHLMNDIGLSKKQRKKQQQMNLLIENKQKGAEDESEGATNPESELLESSNAAAVESRLSGATSDCDLPQGTSGPPTAEDTQDETNPKLTSETRSKTTEKNVKKEKNTTVNSNSIILICQVCKSKFPSKNKLFQHLEKTKHAVYIPDKSSESLDVKNVKSGKVGSKKKSRK